MINQIRYILSLPFFMVGLVLMLVMSLIMLLGAWIQGEQHSEAADEYLAILKEL